MESICHLNQHGLQSGLRQIPWPPCSQSVRHVRKSNEGRDPIVEAAGCLPSTSQAQSDETVSSCQSSNVAFAALLLHELYIGIDIYR